MISEGSIVAIVAALAGSGGFTVLATWATRRLDRRLGHGDAKAINAKLDALDAKLDRVDGKLDNDNRRLNGLEQSSMRGELFAATQNRNQHEHQLQVGRDYTSHGFNGAGHVRIRQLEDDYRQRLALDDWDYTRPPQPKEAS